MCVFGSELTPTDWSETNGFPSVEAIEMPPPFAVLSVDTSAFILSVVMPRTMVLSITNKSSARRTVVVPPMLKFPATKRSLWKVAVESKTSKLVETLRLVAVIKPVAIISSVVIWSWTVRSSFTYRSPPT